MSKELATIQPTQTDSGTLMSLIAAKCDDPQFDVAKLQALLDVKRQWEADEARKAYVAAMAEFKANAPSIAKNKKVAFGNTKYEHATLDNVCDMVIPALSKYGISHRWETEQAGSVIRVTCVLTHVLGHSERTVLEAGADTSGSKNPIQAIGSAVTYLQRYTFLAATGLAVGGIDNDGATPEAKITQEQANEINELLEETGSDFEAFCGWVGHQSLAEIPAAKFQSVIDKLNLKKRKAVKA